VKEYIKAITQRVKEGREGRLYVVATTEELKGSVTFSLDKSCWQENSMPERGTVVVLSELRKKKAGWRAMKARYFKPYDEK